MGSDRWQKPVEWGQAEEQQRQSNRKARYNTAFILPVSIGGDTVDSIPAKSDCKERWKED